MLMPGRPPAGRPGKLRFGMLNLSSSELLIAGRRPGQRESCPLTTSFGTRRIRPAGPLAHITCSGRTRPPAVGSEAYRRRMQDVGTAFRAADVVRIYLIHGTLAGTDALGLLSELERLFPTAGDRLRQFEKQLVDALAGDRGNYTAGYAEELAEAINVPGRSRIEVRRFHWSSENHHLGRADGAVLLIDELASIRRHDGGRVLLWGHSHAGNVLALLTNLVAGDGATRRRFFKAACCFYRRPLTKAVDLPVWTSVQAILSKRGNPLLPLALDVVTFGTPIRYGWDCDGCVRLLHVVNHRPCDGLPAYQASFPPSLDDLFTAEGGDYIQQLGIAGTNFPPSVFSSRSWLAEQRLARLLQPGLRKRWLLSRLKVGRRVAEDGTTLLVDYGPPDGNIGRHLAGHAVYMQLDWLLFHAEEVARQFYNGD